MITSFPPTPVAVRQVMDYRRSEALRRRGSVDPYYHATVFLPTGIAAHRVADAVARTVERYEELRSIFVPDSAGVLCICPRESAAPTSYCVASAIDSPAQKETYLQRIGAGNRQIHPGDGPLFHAHYLYGAVSEVHLFLHPLVGDGDSLTLIKRSFLADLAEKSAAVSPGTYRAYANWKNQQLMTDWPRARAAYLRQFASLSPTIVGEGPAPDATRPRATLHYLQQSEYYDFPARAGRQLCSRIAHPGLVHLSRLRDTYRANSFMLLLGIFARVIRAELGSDRSLIGILYDDRHHTLATESVGKYTGEVYVGLDEVCFEGLDQLAARYLRVIRRFRYPIYNYNFHYIAESALYDHCVGFFNFAVEAGAYSGSAEAEDGLILPDAYCHFAIDPIIRLHDDVLLADWRFDPAVITPERLRRIDDRWRSEVAAALATLSEPGALIIANPTQPIYE